MNSEMKKFGIQYSIFIFTIFTAIFIYYNQFQSIDLYLALSILFGQALWSLGSYLNTHFFLITGHICYLLLVILIPLLSNNKPLLIYTLFLIGINLIFRACNDNVCMLNMFDFDYVPDIPNKSFLYLFIIMASIILYKLFIPYFNS
jgi:hypothetical protein